MMKYANVLNRLYDIYEKHGFSLGLHTTAKANAQEICETGLEERGCRTIEGTVKIFGDVAKDVQLEDLDWFFPYTNATVIVAIPSMWEASRGGDSKSGNEHTCQFSVFCDAVHTNPPHPIFAGFGKNGRKRIPPELIVGFYDKDGNLTINPQCALLQENSPYLKQLEEAWNEPKTQFVYDFYKGMTEFGKREKSKGGKQDL